MRKPPGRPCIVPGCRRSGNQRRGRSNNTWHQMKLCAAHDKQQTRLGSATAWCCTRCEARQDSGVVPDDRVCQTCLATTGRCTRCHRMAPQDAEIDDEDFLCDTCLDRCCTFSGCTDRTHGGTRWCLKHRTCSVPGCSTRGQRVGMCAAHVARTKRHGSPLLAVCRRCDLLRERPVGPGRLCADCKRSPRIKRRR